MNFTKTIINSIKCWVNKQIKDVNEKIADLSTNVNDNFMTKDAMNTKMDAENPIGSGSFSMNRNPDSVVGAFSYAEGHDTIASGRTSHAEGSQTRATGLSSHAEGSLTRATGSFSHAEGYGTRASGMSSHAEGDVTIASGYFSHAEGEHTIAASSSQHVQGKYNIEDAEDKYAHIVGNGDNNVHSNAHTLDWDGNAWFAGDVYVGGTSQDDGDRLIRLSDQMTEDDALELLLELNVVELVTNENGAVFTDENGAIYVL